MGEKNHGIDSNRLEQYAQEIKKVHDLGLELAIVIGGGNIFRGVDGEKSGIDRYSTEIILQGFNSSFKILSNKNSQAENIQDTNIEKSSLPNNENLPSNDLDDEIPF